MSKSFEEALAHSPETDFEALGAVVTRFETARNLNKVAEDLQRQSAKIQEEVGRMLPERCDAEGEYAFFMVEPTRHEAPLVTESYGRLPKGAGAGWARTSIGSFSHSDGVLRKGTYDDEISFLGKTIEYDPTQGRIWVYNKAGNLRVLYGEGARLSVVVDMPGGGD